VSKKILISTFVLLFAWITTWGMTPSRAAGGLDLFTPYTGISVSPGDSVDYTVDIINHTDSIQNVSFKLNGIPKNWNYKITAGGWSVDKLSIKPGKKQ